MSDMIKGDKNDRPRDNGILRRVLHPGTNGYPIPDQNPEYFQYPIRTRGRRPVCPKRSCLLNDPISPEKNNRDHIPEQENKFHFEGVNGGGSNPVFHFFIFILAKKQKRFPFEGVGGSVKSETCSLFLIFILLLWF